MDDQSRRDAIYFLNAAFTRCSPARKVAIARRYQVTEWIEPNLRILLSKKPSELTPQDIRDMDDGGRPTWLTLCQVTQEIHALRPKLAFEVPGITDQSSTTHLRNCRDQNNCASRWLTGYRQVMAPLMHPDLDVASSLLLEDLRREMDSQGLGCWDEKFNELASVGSFFLVRETQIIDQGIQRVAAL